MDYSDRKISSVIMYGLNFAKEEGTLWVASSVKTQIENHEGGYDGPEATISLSVRMDGDNPTLLDAEQAFLSAVPDLLKRLAAETPETLLAAWRAYQKQFP